MGLLILPEYLTRQPVTRPLMNPASLLGRQRWACVHIPGVALFGTANPSYTLRTNTSIGSVGKAGRSIFQTGTASNSGLDYGANSGMRLSTSSGVIVALNKSSSGQALYTTSFTGYSGFPGGFLVGLTTGGAAKIDKHDLVGIITTGNTCPVGKVAVIAWSYNGSTGRARLALNGVLTAATSAQTFTHASCNNGGYYTDAGGGTNPSEIALFAISPDECFSDQELLEASVNPWRIFKQPSRQLWMGADPVSSSLSGGAAGQATATGEISVAVPLVGAAISTANAAGALSSIRPLAGASAAVAVAGGTVLITFRMAGAALAAATGSGNLRAQFALSGAAVLNALSTANLTFGAAGALAGNAVSVASATGNLTSTFPLAGASVAVAGANGNLTVGLSGLSGAALAQAAASGSLSIQVQLSVQSVMQALAAGMLSGGQVPAPAFPTAPFYDLEPLGFALPCAVGITSFPGILHTVDAMSFDAAAHSTHTLRYQDDVNIAPNSMITVAGVNYKALSVPRKINRAEMLASLVIQP
jgi:hypothetical protein